MVLDLEKNAAATVDSNSSNGSDKDRNIIGDGPAPVAVPHKLRVLNDKIEGLAGLEARGITRVLPEERHEISALRYLQILIVWWGANITANNLAVGLLGPLLFGLGFTDSVMMVVFGCMLGALFPAYTSTWGPQSGNRTMVRRNLQGLSPTNGSDSKHC